MFGDEKKLGSFLSRMIPVLIGLSAIFEKKKLSQSQFFLFYFLYLLFFLPKNELL